MKRTIFRLEHPASKLGPFEHCTQSHDFINQVAEKMFYPFGKNRPMLDAFDEFKAGLDKSEFCQYYFGCNDIEALCAYFNFDVIGYEWHKLGFRMYAYSIDGNDIIEDDVQLVFNKETSNLLFTFSIEDYLNTMPKHCAEKAIAA